MKSMPVPFGPCILCPLIVSRSAFIFSTSIGYFPNACTASRWNSVCGFFSFISFPRHCGICRFCVRQQKESGQPCADGDGPAFCGDRRPSSSIFLTSRTASMLSFWEENAASAATPRAAAPGPFSVRGGNLAERGQAGAYFPCGAGSSNPTGYCPGERDPIELTDAGLPYSSQSICAIFSTASGIALVVAALSAVIPYEKEPPENGLRQFASGFSGTTAGIFIDPAARRVPAKLCGIGNPCLPHRKGSLPRPLLRGGQGTAYALQREKV